MLGESVVKGVGMVEETCDPPVVSRHPSSSIHYLCNGPEEQQQQLPLDSDVQLAVEALGDLKNLRPPPTSTLPTPHPAFIERMSHMPLISSIGNAYEATKKVSRVVKYSAESVESGVKTIAKPVLHSLEPALAPLDRFACSQLDMLEKSFSYLKGGQKPAPVEPPAMRHRTLSTSSNMSMDLTSASSAALNSPSLAPSSLQQQQSPYVTRTGVNARSLPVPTTRSPSLEAQQQQQQGGEDSKKRGRKWHQVVVGVGANLGSMMMTEDMVRGLRYCLEWLKYATGHIDAQVSILLNYLARLGVSVKNGVASAVGVTIDTTNAVIPANTDELRTLLINIKRQVAETLRNVVDVVGKYAAHCLPGEARNSVRGFILSLPSRWASINNRFKTPTNPTDASSVVMASENSTMKESQKVLTLATESSAMLKGIQEVVEASVGGGVPSSTTTGIETSVNGGSTPSHPMKRSKGKTDSAMDISDDEDQHFEEAQEDTN